MTEVKKKDPPAPDHPDFWPAVAAAIIDEDRAQFTPGFDEHNRPEPPHAAFTRAHVEMLRDLGCDRGRILAYAESFLNRAQVAKLADDLGSYGVF